MQYSRQHSRKASLISLAALLLLQAPAAPATEVTTNDGGTAAGGFRYVVSRATDGESITFSQGVTSIRPTGEAASAVGNLNITGNGRSTFDSSLQTLLGTYLDGPKNYKLSDYFLYDLDEIDAYDWTGYGTNLSSALSNLTRPTPTFDGSALASDARILTLSSVDGTSRLRAVTMNDVGTSVRGIDVNNSAVTGTDVSTESLKSYSGGAVTLSGSGFFESDSFSGNDLEVIGGTVRGGIGSNTADTTTEATAYGGAVSASAGQTTGSVFTRNTVTARAGAATAGSLTDVDGTSMDTTASATASGGAMYLTGQGAFSGSVFQSNTATAYGGAVSGGTSASTSYYTENHVGTTASGGAVSLGGGTVTGSIFQGNTASATGGSVSGVTASWTDTVNAITAFGGAVASDSRALAVTGSVFHGNAVSVTPGSLAGSMFTGNGSNICDSYTMLSGDAFGGAVASLVAIEVNTVTDSVFCDNTVSLQGGTVAGSTMTNVGAGYASIYAATVANGGAVSFNHGSVSTSFFENNRVTITGGTATGSKLTATDGGSATTQFNVQAVGGAVKMSGGAVTKSVFTANSIKAEGGSTAGGSVTQTGTDFSGYLYSYAATEAAGGAVGFYSYYDGTVSGSVFLDNTISVKGGSAVAATFIGTDRSDLDAQAAAFAVGMGGAVAFDMTGSIIGSLLSGNSVTAVGGSRAVATTVGSGSTGWANADAYALGGAVYFGGQTNSITNSTLTYNSVTATAGGTVVQGGVTRQAKAYALGGAVFVNTERVLSAPADPAAVIPTTFGLNATDGNKTLIAHNTANGVASGIHFGSAGRNDETGYARSQTDGAIFTVNTNKTGQVHLLDPVTVDIYSDTPGEKSKFVMNVTGTGTFVWGGKNVLDANGGSTINLNSGTVTLVGDFSLGATAGVDYRTGSATDAYATATTTAPATNLNDLVVNIAKTATVKIDVTRSTSLAAFDFAGATNAGDAGIFKVASGTVLAVETENTRQLLDLEDTFLLASGLSRDDTDAALAAFTKGTGVDSITASSGKIFVNVDYVSPYMTKLRQNLNSYRAAKALNVLVSDRSLISDKQFAAIKANLRAVTPEYAVSQMLFAARVVGSIADIAQFDYFDRYEVLRSRVDDYYGVTRGTDCLTPVQGKRRLSRLRLWGGYVGDYSSMERHNGYESYKMSTEGVMVGGDGKIDRCTSLGFYCAYLDETTHFRSVNAGVNADGLQFGLLWRRHMARGWTWTGDFGYAYFDNDGYRYLDAFRARSGFDQNALTAGMGFEYDILRGPCRIKPFLRTRLAQVWQGGTTENGDTGTETRVSSFDGTSFTTNLGFELAHRFSWRSATFVPRMSFSWLHEFADKNFETGGFYTGIGPVTGFRMSSAHQDRDRFVLGTDLRSSFCGFRGRPWSFIMAYDYIVSGHTNSHTATAGLEFRF